jgi:hypothetical protein
MRNLARENLEKRGFKPTKDGLIASVILSNGVKLSVDSAPCFCPFSFLILSIKKFYPSELTEGVYFYSPVKMKKLDDDPVELVKSGIVLVDESNLDALIGDHFSRLIVEDKS